MIEKFETWVYSNDTRYMRTNGVVCIHVHETREDAQRDADRINADMTRTGRSALIRPVGE